MKSLIILALAALACFCTASAAQVQDFSSQNDDVPAGQNSGTDFDAGRTKEDLDVPAVDKNDDVKVDGDKLNDETPRSLDGNNEISKNPASRVESVSTFQQFEVKNGQVLKNKSGGEKTIVDENGRRTIKFGDSP